MAVTINDVAKKAGVSHTTVSALGIETCTNVVISQDGIDAYLNDFNFAVCGLDFSDQLQLTSVSANGDNGLVII